MSQLKELDEMWTQDEEVGLQSLKNVDSVPSTSRFEEDGQDDLCLENSRNEVSSEVVASAINHDFEMEHDTRSESIDTFSEVRMLMSSLVTTVVVNENSVDFFSEKSDSKSLTITHLDIKMPPSRKRKG